MSKLMKVEKKIEKGVVSGYKAVEKGVLCGYLAVEEGFVSGYKKIEDKFVDAFLSEGNGSRKEASEQTDG